MIMKCGGKGTENEPPKRNTDAIIDWYKERPFGRISFSDTLDLQYKMRAREEGLSLDEFKEALAGKRNGELADYFKGNRFK